MEYEEYSKIVWEWITPDLDRPDVTPYDIEHLEKSIRNFYDKGWTFSEARRFLMCTEEVNPELDEETALARMKIITEAVRTRLGRQDVH